METLIIFLIAIIAITLMALNMRQISDHNEMENEIKRLKSDNESLTAIVRRLCSQIEKIVNKDGHQQIKRTITDKQIKKFGNNEFDITVQISKNNNYDMIYTRTSTGYTEMVELDLEGILEYLQHLLELKKNEPIKIIINESR